MHCADGKHGVQTFLLKWTIVVCYLLSLFQSLIKFFTLVHSNFIYGPLTCYYRIPAESGLCACEGAALSGETGGSPQQGSVEKNKRVLCLVFSQRLLIIFPSEAKMGTMQAFFTTFEKVWSAMTSNLEGKTGVSARKQKDKEKGGQIRRIFTYQETEKKNRCRFCRFSQSINQSQAGSVLCSK